MKVSDFMKYEKGGRKDSNPDTRAARRERAKTLYRLAKRAKAKKS